MTTSFSLPPRPLWSGRFCSVPSQNRLLENMTGYFRRRLSLATEIVGIFEYYGHTVTARTTDEPYFMWRREPSCLPWKTTPADMLRVDNTEHTQPILFMSVPALPNDGIHAKDIEVCLRLCSSIFRVNACCTNRESSDYHLKG